MGSSGGASLALQQIQTCVCTVFLLHQLSAGHHCNTSLARSGNHKAKPGNEISLCTAFAGTTSCVTSANHNKYNASVELISRCITARKFSVDNDSTIVKSICAAYRLAVGMYSKSRSLSDAKATLCFDGFLPWCAGLLQVFSSLSKSICTR